MKALLMIAVVACGFAATPAIAETKDVKDPDRLICRNEPVLGSRTRRNRICMTAAEWKKVELEGKSYMKGVEKANSTFAPAPGPFGQ